MSNLWGIDLTPLIKEVQQNNQNQHQIIALLQEQNQLLKNLVKNG